MAVRNTLNINYLEEQTSTRTYIDIFQYERPTPQSNMLRFHRGTITLPLPDYMPNDEYSMQLSTADTGALGAGLNAYFGGSDKAGAIADLRKTLRERIGTDSDSIANAIAIMDAAPAISDGLRILSPQLRLSAGLTRNPHMAVLFEGVNLRRLQYKWKLSPRSAAQSRRLDQIINRIQIAMHPNLELGGFALNYPNLVTVKCTNDKKGIVQSDFSFIQDMQVNPTPHGHAYYREGYPSIVEMSLVVDEVRIKTAEDFEGTNATLPGTVRRR
jgi:hypothetical protein